jgi:adenine-specific DNA-methyltransferase
MDKLKMQTSNLADANFAALAALFPNAVTETIDANGAVVRAIDKDVLAQEINAHVVEGREERYQFTWPDKRKSVLLANAPIAAALRPCREESVDFDTTENLYIEGDNLDVLKLLRETYLNRVKMIYIDLITPELIQINVSSKSGFLGCAKPQRGVQLAAA